MIEADALTKLLGAGMTPADIMPAMATALRALQYRQWRWNDEGRAEYLRLSGWSLNSVGECWKGLSGGRTVPLLAAVQQLKEDCAAFEQLCPVVGLRSYS